MPENGPRRWSSHSSRGTALELTSSSKRSESESDEGCDGACLAIFALAEGAPSEEASVPPVLEAHCEVKNQRAFSKKAAISGEVEEGTC